MVATVINNRIQRASWLELFYDLAFVALTAQFTYLIVKNHQSWIDVLNICIVGYTIFITWWSTTAARNLQGSELFADKLVVQMQMVGAFLMSLTMPAVFEGDHFGYFTILAIMRLTQISLIMRTYRLNPETKPNTNNILHGFAIASALWLLSAVLATPWHFVVALQALALDVLAPLTRGKGNKVRLLNLGHMQERLGLFIMLVLGESMLVVALTNLDATVSLFQVLVVFSGLLAVISTWWMYYDYLEDCIEGQRPQHFFTFLHGHGFLALGIICLAASYNKMLEGGAIYGVDILLLLAGTLCIFMALSLIRYSIYSRFPRLLGRFLLCAVVVSVVALVSSPFISTITLFLTVITSVFVTTAVFDVWSRS